MKTPTTLNELIISVREQNLTKDQLEGYRDQLSDLYAQMQMEMADIEKQEALFPNDYPTAVARKNAWKATEPGQRLIVLKRYCLACKEILNSLKSRLYSMY